MIGTVITRMIGTVITRMTDTNTSRYLIKLIINFKKAYYKNATSTKSPVWKLSDFRVLESSTPGLVLCTTPTCKYEANQYLAALYRLKG